MLTRKYYLRVLACVVVVALVFQYHYLYQIVVPTSISTPRSLYSPQKAHIQQINITQKEKLAILHPSTSASHQINTNPPHYSSSNEKNNDDNNENNDIYSIEVERIPKTCLNGGLLRNGSCLCFKEWEGMLIYCNLFF